MDVKKEYSVGNMAPVVQPDQVLSKTGEYEYVDDAYNALDLKLPKFEQADTSDDEEFTESDKSDKTKKEEKKKDKATDKKDKGKDTSITDIIGLVIEIIKQIVWSFSHVKLKKLSLYYIAGGTDPADTATKYGIACATIYPAISFIMSLMKVNNKKVNVNIKCDFNKEETVLDFHIAISIRIVFIVIAGLRLLFKEIVKNIKGNRNNG